MTEGLARGGAGAHAEPSAPARWPARYAVLARHDIEEVELGQLERRFAALRVAAPRRLEALVRSIERSGQLSAVVAVRDDARLVLVDGYLRIAALRRLGVDTAWVAVWACALEAAVAQVLASTQARGWDVIEEALMLRELTSVHGLTQHEVALRSGRDVSWVSRRLKLLDGLPDTALEAICQGVLSSWAASRILAPLARANHAHAHALLEALRRERLSTRELGVWYQHYSQATRATRERLVANPALFVHSVQARANARAEQQLHDGPEGECVAEVQRLEALLGRLRRRLAKVCAHAPLPLELEPALASLKGAFERLDHELRGYRDDSTPAA
jgi:ParB-like chromosome segregation protein Spo0J